MVVEAQGAIDTAQQGLLEQGHIQSPLVVEAQGNIQIITQRQVVAVGTVHFMATPQLAVVAVRLLKTGSEHIHLPLQGAVALVAVQGSRHL